MQLTEVHTTVSPQVSDGLQPVQRTLENLLALSDLDEYERTLLTWLCYRPDPLIKVDELMAIAKIRDIHMGRGEQ